MNLPPVHPAVVHFPVALLVFSVVADIIGHARGKDSLRAAAFWSLIGAALGAAVAVAAGYYDMNRANLSESVHEFVHFHRKVGWVLLASIVGLTIWRAFIYSRPKSRVGWGYLTVALLTMGLTLFQGWWGGEMVYGHGASVAPTGQGVAPAADAKSHLEAVGKVFGIGEGHKEGGDEHQASGDKSTTGAQTEGSAHEH